MYQNLVLTAGFHLKKILIISIRAISPMEIIKNMHKELWKGR